MEQHCLLHVMVRLNTVIVVYLNLWLLIFSSATCDAPLPLGMEDRGILDSQISANARASESFSPWRARPNLAETSSYQGAGWKAPPDGELLVDLLLPHTITTLGIISSDYSTFVIKHSMDFETWTTLPVSLLSNYISSSIL